MKFDLKDQQFGSLKVLNRVPRNDRKPKDIWWACLCKCGEITEVPSQRLRRGNTTSCGCFQKECARKSIKVLHKKAIKLDGPFNKILRWYKSHSKKMGRDFDLSPEEFRMLIQQNCYYCGAKPSNTATAQSGLTFKYNGIDRLFSENGYFISNCVPCCIDCNWMKKDTPINDFIYHIRKIAKFTENL